MENKEAYRKAEQRVSAKMGFYTHFCIYLGINLILFFINRETMGADGYQWFIWPLLGWGIVIFFHFMGVFVFSAGIRERMIQKELERQNRNR
jgi:two-component system, LytTR family, sensor kinase